MEESCYESCMWLSDIHKEKESTKDASLDNKKI